MNRYDPQSDPAYELVRNAHNLDERWAAAGVVRYAIDHLLDDPKFIKEVGLLTVETLKKYAAKS